MDESGGSGAPPSLINLADDATDVMLHFVPPGESTVGSNPQGPRHLQLSSSDIQPVHANISYAASKVMIRPHAPNCILYVNGAPLPPSAPPCELQHGHRLGFGEHAEFRLNLPWEAARNRARNAPRSFYIYFSPVFLLNLSNTLHFSGVALEHHIGSGAGAFDHTPKRAMRERSSGIGIVLQQLGKFLTVVDVKPFSLAETNGRIAVGQCIVKVNGRDVTGLAADEVVKLLDFASVNEVMLRAGIFRNFPTVSPLLCCFRT
jgi:hypothetical protein